MFKGSLVALVTPMHADGSIDEKSVSELVDWHIETNTKGLIIAGTTGEGSTLEASEQFKLIKNIVKQVRGRIPVIAGTGSNSTEHAIALTKQAKEAGSDACLIVTPYYNKPTQAGLFSHYQKITESVSIPFILYNVPSRTACDLLPETIEKLSGFKNIIGIKEATGKIERSQEIIKRCGSEFFVWSGDDLSSLDLILQAGAKGVISVTANVAPAQMSAMCEAALDGEVKLAHKINDSLVSLHKSLFLESNPIPTKWALHKLGKIPAGLRLPLTTLNEKYHAELQKALANAGITASLG